MTPISSDLQNEILNEWYEWCDAVSSNSLNNDYTSCSNSNVIERSKLKKKYRKKAIFNGQFEVGYIPVNYTVEWI